MILEGNLYDWICILRNFFWLQDKNLVQMELREFSSLLLQFQVRGDDDGNSLKVDGSFVFKGVA